MDAITTGFFLYKNLAMLLVNSRRVVILYNEYKMAKNQIIEVLNN